MAISYTILDIHVYACINVTCTLHDIRELQLVVVVMVTFSSHARIFEVNHSLHKLFKWRSALAHQLHSLGQDQSTAAQRAETTEAHNYLPL